MRELGRIRTGVQVSAKGGRMRPEKLDTFRLTSSSRELIEHAAAVYGGEVQAWQDGWEVVTTSPTLEIMVPPGQSVSQWYELWSAGGCQRRCDGRVNVLTDGPCLCPADPDERRAAAAALPPTACKPTTRLNVMLPELPDIGVWRLESHGFYAAVELAGAAEILAFASNAGRPIPARLRLDQRDKKVPGKPTNRYAVPVIEFIETRYLDLIDAGAAPARQLGTGLGVRHEGPEAELPAESDFRAPVPTGDVADPADLEGLSGASTATAEDAIAAGELPTGDALKAASPLAGELEEGEFREDAEPEGLTQEDLIAKLNAAKVGLAYAVEEAKLAFPDRPEDVPLTPAQRLTLWRKIEAQLAG
jgi:hypothetical protein